MSSTETPTRNTSSGSGGGGSRGGGSGGGSRYHGGGYNGGGHRPTRYTTPRHTATKARYRPPTRPASVTPVAPAPDPYLTCRACTFIWVIPIAVGITEAAIDTGITIGIGISIGILADKIRERIHIAHQEANTPTPDGQSGSSARPQASDARILNDPESLSGATPDEVRELIPEGWEKRPLKKAEGERWLPKKPNGDSVAIEKGNPKFDDPLHNGPYLKVSHNGRIARVPLKGNPVLKKPR